MFHLERDRSIRRNGSLHIPRMGCIHEIELVRSGYSPVLYFQRTVRNIVLHSQRRTALVRRIGDDVINAVEKRTAWLILVGDMISAQECSEQVRPGTGPISAAIHEMPAGGCHCAVRQYLGVIAVFCITSIDIQVSAVPDSQSVVNPDRIAGSPEIAGSDDRLCRLVCIGRDRECHGDIL